MRTRGIQVVFLGFLLGACTLDASEENVDSKTAPIIRGREEKRFPQAVFLEMQRFPRSARCSGVYVAPRVVVTAAHCIVDGIFPNGFFVYFGDDFTRDLALLPNIPAPGQRSPWARAETWEVHPDYDPLFNYPDFAVVYLDRELPFAPLPLARFPLDRHWIGENGLSVGWGANKALSADIQQVEGVGVKRSGRQTILGSPTEADFHLDDPNPGILDPAIRRNLLKLDGRAPRPNTCAGDSGGPFIVEKHGQNFVAAINFWTGLFCEDYAMDTRVEPFLRYFDDAFRRAGRAPIEPRLECVANNGGRSFTAYFGYRNDNAVTVNIPFGPRNFFPDDDDRERPSAFGPGDHPWVFGVDFDVRDRLDYRLNPPSGRTTTLRVDARSRRCDPNDQFLICANECNAVRSAQCFDGSISFEACESECVFLATQVFIGCEAEWNSYLRCVSGLSPAASNWLCTDGFLPSPAPPSCGAEFAAAFTCAGF